MIQDSYDYASVFKEDNMFDNIHGKIKLLAKIEFWSGVALGIIILFTNMDGGATILAIGTVVPLIGYINALFFYGFGEIIEKLTDIKKSVNEIAEAANNNPEKAKQEEISRALKF